MTYTKKRIIIEADVPDGATHYVWWNEKFRFVKAHSDGQFLYWFKGSDGLCTKWALLKESKYSYVKPIEEVIE